VAEHEDEDSNLLQDKEQAELWQALEALDEIGQEDPTRALAMFASLPDEVRGIVDFQLAHASLLRAAGDLPAAQCVLEAVLVTDHEDADAHHLLGEVFEELGKFEPAQKHFLETLRIDSLANLEHSAAEIEDVLDATLEHLEHSIKELPALWQARLEGVPLLVQRLPSEDMVRTGLDPRALGLFEGPMHAEAEGIDCAPLPTRIVLFAENLALDFPDAEDFREQVRITVLHELGHYFGLDEDDMARLGLD
jgi:predicted Zn-dependent protease with MMP-like domain